MIRIIAEITGCDIITGMETGDHEMDLSTILNSSHENKWVAIAPDYSRVLAATNTLSELTRLITDPKAVFHRVLPHNVSFVPAAR